MSFASSIDACYTEYLAMCLMLTVDVFRGRIADSAPHRRDNGPKSKKRRPELLRSDILDKRQTQQDNELYSCCTLAKQSPTTSGTTTSAFPFSIETNAGSVQRERLATAYQALWETGFR